jgi:uncharacterized coiled-coil protein SlyX
VIEVIMSIAAGFGQKRRGGLALVKRLIRRAEFMVTGRRLFLAGTGGLVLLVAGMAAVWGFGGSSDIVSHPAVVTTTYAQRPDDLAETAKDLKITQQETIDQLQAVQDLVASQQVEMKKLSDQVRALSAELGSLKQAPLIANPLVLPKTAHSKPR